MSKTIPQLDNADPLSLTNKIEVSQSDSPSAESKYCTFDELIDEIVNPNSQLESTSQVTGLPESLTDLQDQINALAPVISHEVYVRPEGSDVTGDGTASNPYATISHTNSITTDATFNNQYLINAYGHFTDTDWAIKPNISYDFNGGTYDVTNTITLDPSWGGDDSSVVIANAFNCVWTAGANLDFQSFDLTGFIVFFSSKNIQVNTSADINIFGNLVAPCFVSLEHFWSTQDVPVFLVEDCYTAINDVLAYQFTLNHTATSLGAFSYITNLATVDKTDFSNATSWDLNLYLTNCRLNTTSFASSDGGIFTVNSVGTIYDNGIILDSDDPATLLFKPDILSTTPALLGSAVFVPSSIANSINANITPTGYSTEGPAVSQHLTGISNQFDALDGGVYTPVLTPISGISGSVDLVSARYAPLGSTQLIVCGEVSLTANASAISFGVSLPSGFTVSGASPMGAWLTTSSPNVGDGNPVSITPNMLNNYVVVTVNATVSSDVKIIPFSFMADA